MLPYPGHVVMGRKRREGPDDASQPLSRPLLLDQHEAVEMIGHHHDLIDTDVVKPIRQSVPDLARHAASGVWMEVLLDHIAKERESLVGADRDEMAAGLGVVIVGLTERRAALWRIVGHAPAV